MKEIDVYISKDGTVKVSVAGIPGASCESLTEALQGRLGDELQHERTHEFYLPGEEGITCQSC